MNALESGHFNEEVEENRVKLAIEDAVKVLLQGLGEDINREGIRKTPSRVAKALREATKGYKQHVNDVVHGALFPEAGLGGGCGQAGGAGGLVIVRDLDLFSYCESCLLPFQVRCQVGYVPSGQRVVGLSKLSRVADIFAKRLQAPQRLADEICTALQHGIKPTGVAVVLQCLHIHFPNSESAFLDTSHQSWVKMLVSSGSGVFKDEKADIWTDLLSLLNFRGISKENTNPGVFDQSWCPSQCCNKLEQSNSAMTNAVVSILKSLGEDPSRKELVGTPYRFLKWLMNFRNSNMENGFLQSRINSPSPKDFICSELNLPFWSQCEHHLLPFQGVVHIGYFSSNGLNSVGRSKLQSIVHFYGFKLQVQERLTRQIAETTSSLLGEDIIVVVEASHTCMISRGIEKFGSSTATIAVLGRFSTDPATRAKFLKSLPSFSSA
ncbi:PREDICTED: GTP cyclohydrolase 1-like [Nicotiana attenuata]|uniref:GTP cyclohydrolase 1 n=1 Tax=Nicotiana attenuata TaxID=49451 RepID=A0A314L049_NICAT|nr:PREDICTED: GTP cyclohydrolase 1-like [Nicotiana attenuata]OIT35026.1 gtp cyclohydrolase 1 [Nicotiana attenuata]